MKNGLLTHMFALRVYFILLFLSFAQIAFCQSDSKDQLDTLATLVNEVERLEYILKIEETQNILVQDSILTIAIELADQLKDDRKAVEVWMAWCHVDWRRGDFEASYEKMLKAYEITERLDDAAATASVLNNMGNYYQRKNQYEQADSLFKLCIAYWQTNGDQKSLSKGYNNRAILCIKKQEFDKADSLVAIAKVVADELGDRRVQASAMTTQFVIQAVSGRKQDAFKTASDLLDTMLPVAHQYPDFYAGSVLNYAQISQEVGQLEQAMVQLMKADSIYNLYDLEYGRVSVLETTANVFATLGDTEQAIIYYKRCLALGNRNGDQSENISTYNTIANMYLTFQDTTHIPIAKVYNDSSYQIALEVDSKIGQANCHITSSKISLLLGEPDAALILVERAITLLQQIDSPVLLNSCIFQKAEMLATIGRPAEAKREFEKVQLKYFELAQDSTSYYYLKGEIAKEIGDYKTAAFALSRAYSSNDSLRDLTQAAEIKEIGDKYQTEKQVALNEQLKAEQQVKELTIARQQNYLLYGGLGLGLVSLLTFLLFRQGRRKEQLNAALQKQKKQVQLLNQELNHRVKNNLAFMTSLLEMQGRRSTNEETKQALQESESRLKALSLVHVNLFKNETDTQINLKEYLLEIMNHLKDIFEIENKSLTIQTHLIDKIVDAEDAMRIGLIVNELVTNSVKHAFADVDAPTILIETTSREDKVVLRYKDNGPGIAVHSLPQEARKQSLGVKLIKLMEQQLSEVLELNVATETS